MQRTLTFMHKMLEVKKKWGEKMTRAMMSRILMPCDPRSKAQKGEFLHWQVQVVSLGYTSECLCF